MIIVIKGIKTVNVSFGFTDKIVLKDIIEEIISSVLLLSVDVVIFSLVSFIRSFVFQASGLI
jgi:hypothetical protein